MKKWFCKVSVTVHKISRRHMKPKQNMFCNVDSGTLNAVITQIYEKVFIFKGYVCCCMKEFVCHVTILLSAKNCYV